MYPRFKPLVALLPAVFASVAQSETADLGTVVVTATRQPARTNELLSDVTVISRGQIEQAGHSTLAQLLESQPGIQVATSGGVGGTSGIYIRGANSGHTLLLVDGVRFGSSTTGQPTLEDIPLSQIERIEIVRGAASSLYGADVIGGVIQIFTRRGEGKPAFDASVGGGTYSTYNTTAGFSGAVGAVDFSLRAGHYETKGIDAMRNPTDRDGFRQDHVSGRIGWKLSASTEVGATAFESRGVSQYDGGTNFDNRIRKNASIYSAYWKQSVTDGWLSTVRTSRSQDAQDDIDPAFPSRIVTSANQFLWQNDLRLPVGKLLLAYEYLGEHVQNNLSNLIKDERRTNSYLAGWSAPLGAHRLQVNARYDDNSQYGGRTTGSGSYGYQFSDDWRAYASVGRAFKAPTFNDLFFPQLCFPPFGCFGGNPNLKPETALNREAGLVWETAARRASLVYFDNKVADLIVWTNQPFNVGRAHLKGTTATYDIAYGLWSAGVSATHQEPRDADTGQRLFRRADDQLTTKVSRRLGDWNLGGEVVAYGRRDDFDFNANRRVRLGGYGIVNAFAAYRLAPEWSLDLRVNNLGDKNYVQSYGFQTPGLNAFLALRYSPK